MRSLTTKRQICLLAASIVLSMVSFAQSESETNTTGEESTTATVPKSSGRKAYIDPDTGELTSQPPSGQELEQGQQVFQQSTEGLVEEIHPDGSASVDLQGRFRAPLRVRKNCDGTLTSWHGGEETSEPEQLNDEKDCVD